MDVVITHPRNAVSAVRLGLPVVTALLERAERYTNIINWGCSDGPDGENVINKPSQIALSVDKPEFIHTMREYSVSVPEIFMPGTTLPAGQFVMRPDHHAEGNEFALADRGERIAEGYHATRFITPTREYRIWFSNSNYITAKRIPRPSEGEVNETCRSKWGYKPVENFPGAIELIKKARQVVKLDFGAADLLWAINERKWYLLEFNSAPSLDTERVRSFMVSGIKSMMKQPAPVVPPPAPRQPAVRKIKVWTDTGLQEITING